MSDLISRQKAIKKFEEYVGLSKVSCDAHHMILSILRSLPSAEPEWKTGHWIDTDNYYQRWKCSECGCHTRDAEPNYCPNCGAKMEMRNDE